MGANTGFLFLISLLLFLYYQRQRVKKLLNVLRIKRKRGVKPMAYIIESFLGKDCLLNLASGGTADGIVRSVSEGWVTLEDQDGKLQAVNMDYVSRIREYPKNKNGKRKMVVE